MKTEKNILIAFILNASFSLIELIGGIFTNSVAIISDAVHDFGDSISIGVSYFLEKKSKKKPDNRYTFGYMRYSVLGAIITNTILITGSVLVIYNAVLRILNPTSINYDGMIIVAFLGAIINFLAAYFTRSGKSLNQKAVNLHMLEDVLGWLIVLIGAIIIKFTEFNLIDSLMSILVAIFILINAIKSFKEVLDLFLEKIPSGISIEQLKEHIKELDHVLDVHHIHVWSIDGVNNYATMHVVTDFGDTTKLKLAIKNKLKEHGICHVTVEFEGKNDQCDDLICSPNFSVTEIHHNHHHH